MAFRLPEEVGMLHVVDSTKPLERLVSDLEQAITRHKFGVLGVHDLRAKLAEKGVLFGSRRATTNKTRLVP